MPTSRPRQKLSRRQRRLRYVARRLLLAAAVAAVAAGLVLADRYGVFGRRPVPDFQKYHGKTFRVVHVVDGDTLDVDCPDGDQPFTRIRLWGVDTPEVARPDRSPDHFGPEASRFAATAASGKQVTLELDRRDTRGKFGRLLAYVSLPDERMLNRVLIEQGYGYADPRFDHRYMSQFRRLQVAARKARRGLWKSVRGKDLPRYYRGKIQLPARDE